MGRGLRDKITFHKYHKIHKNSISPNVTPFALYFAASLLKKPPFLAAFVVENETITVILSNAAFVRTCKKGKELYWRKNFPCGFWFQEPANGQTHIPTFLSPAVSCTLPMSLGTMAFRGSKGTVGSIGMLLYPILLMIRPHSTSSIWPVGTARAPSPDP